MRMTPSSGNVFQDIGHPPEEAAAMLLRADLLLSLSRVVRAFADEAAAAKALKVSRRVIADVRGGRIERFDVEQLVGLLRRAGIVVRMTTSRAATRRRAA